MAGVNAQQASCCLIKWNLIFDFFLGRYDGQVYVHNRLTGETSWTFQTGAAVKSSLCIDPLTGVAWFRSHDHYLYALDVTYKRCISTTHCSASLDV